MTVLQYIRYERRLTTADVAELTGLSQPTVNMIERLRLNPSPEELAALGRALNIDPPSLLLEEVKLIDRQRIAVNPDLAHP